MNNKIILFVLVLLICMTLLFKISPSLTGKLNFSDSQKHDISTHEDSEGSKIILIGIDAADWYYIKPLLRKVNCPI